MLAMGCVIKQSAGRRKVRITLDASAPHDGTSLNARIECPPTKLASVRQARAGLAELTADGDEVWMFTADLVDAYLQNPCAEESVNHLGIEWKGEVYVYVRMPFGVSSAPAAQQTLLCALMRAAMRRWTRAGIVCGSMPGYDHHQDWPGAPPRAAAVVSSPEEAQTTTPAPILRRAPFGCGPMRPSQDGATGSGLATDPDRGRRRGDAASKTKATGKLPSPSSRRGLF